MGKNGNRKNILIVKPGAIGDLLQLTPAIRALAACYQGARISILVGTRSTASLFQFNPYIAETIVFDRRNEHRSCLSLLTLWRHLKKRKYDLVIHFQRSNMKTWLLATAALPCRVLVYHKTRSRTVHVVDDYLETLIPLGISGQNRILDLSVGKDDVQFADDLFTANDCHGKIVVALNPGASHPVNRWGAERFTALADLLLERLSARIIIIGGQEDRPLADKIAAATAARPIVLSGKATLLQLGAVLRKCELLVSGDTGPLHLASAVGTRVVALFGAADPARTGPVGAGHRVIQATGVPCLPCRSRSCNNSHYLECMNKISVREVVDAILDMVKVEQDKQI